jgi:1-acyl-sn-glycerol-3-phosphate acyltransferase
MKLETLRSIINFLVQRIFQMEYIDPQYVPATGGCIIATNHLSRLDIPILFVTPGRDYVTALAADKYKKYFVFRWMLDTVRVIWIDRENADFGALRASVEYLHKGVALGIAPEGTRSKGALIEGKAGIALIADKSGMPIIPVGIAGTESGVRKMLTLRRAKITVRFGKPFFLPPMDRSDRAGWLKCSTDEIMCRIAALLPPIYRGYYADHPRLKELLSADSV